MTRKDFLHRSCALSAGLVAASAPGCSLIFDQEMLLCTLPELEEKGFVQKEFNWNDIIALPGGDGQLTVFSLVCSHKKCTVAWKPREREFACPCHEGRYNEHGEVIDGPPPAPLSRFQWELRGQEVWVLHIYLES